MRNCSIGATILFLVSALTSGSFLLAQSGEHREPANANSKGRSFDPHDFSESGTRRPICNHGTRSIPLAGRLGHHHRLLRLKGRRNIRPTLNSSKVEPCWIAIRWHVTRAVFTATVRDLYEP